MYKYWLKNHTTVEIVLVHLIKIKMRNINFRVFIVYYISRLD